MFQNMLMTSFTPLSAKTEINSWENQPFAVEWPANTQQYQHIQVKETTAIIKKRPKRTRTSFTTQQLEELEKAFVYNNYIDRVDRTKLSAFLKISDRCIKIWFQNRRMKKKRESLESSDDSSIMYFNHPSPQSHASQSQPIQTNIHNTQEMRNQYYSNNVSNNYQLPFNYPIEMEPRSANLEQPYDASELRLIDADARYYSPHNENYNMSSTSIDPNISKYFYGSEYTPL